jgi:hypothetical protein
MKILFRGRGDIEPGSGGLPQTLIQELLRLLEPGAARDIRTFGQELLRLLLREMPVARHLGRHFPEAGKPKCQLLFSELRR